MGLTDEALRHSTVSCLDGFLSQPRGQSYRDQYTVVCLDEHAADKFTYRRSRWSRTVYQLEADHLILADQQGVVKFRAN